MGILFVLNRETGESLFPIELRPVPTDGAPGGQATPMTYEAEGAQYVVIAAGGHGRIGSRLGDAVVAFRLAD